jgi:very-short-patch-repair endonuclease
MRALKLDDGMVREHRFAAPRKWKFDFAWPELMIAVEIEGGIWNEGRHTRGAGFAADVEKYNAAAMDGWRVLRYTSAMVADGSAFNQVALALAK